MIVSLILFITFWVSTVLIIRDVRVSPKPVRLLSSEEYEWNHRPVPSWPDMPALKDSPEFGTLKELDEWWESHTPNPERRVKELEQKLMGYETMLKKYAAGSMFQSSSTGDFDTVPILKMKLNSYQKAYRKIQDELDDAKKRLASYEQEKGPRSIANYGGVVK